MKYRVALYLTVSSLVLTAAFGSVRNDSYIVSVDDKMQTATIRSPDAKSKSDVINGLCVKITHLQITRKLGSGLSLFLSIQILNGFSEDIYIRSIEADDIGVSAAITTLQNQTAQASGLVAFRSGRKNFTFLAGRARTGNKTGIRADSFDWLSFTKTLAAPGSHEMYKLIHSPEIDGAVANVTISIPIHFNRSGIDSLSTVKIEIPVKTTITSPESIKEKKNPNKSIKHQN